MLEIREGCVSSFLFNQTRSKRTYAKTFGKNSQGKWLDRLPEIFSARLLSSQAYGGKQIHILYICIICYICLPVYIFLHIRTCSKDRPASQYYSVYKTPSQEKVYLSWSRVPKHQNHPPFPILTANLGWGIQVALWTTRALNSSFTYICFLFCISYLCYCQYHSLNCKILNQDALITRAFLAYVHHPTGHQVLYTFLLITSWSCPFVVIYTAANKNQCHFQNS